MANKAVFILNHAYYWGHTLRGRLRMDKGAEVFWKEKADYLITCGGKGWWFNTSKEKGAGRLMKEYLIQKGIPEGKILEENVSLNTWGNVREALKLIKKNGITEVILVTSGDHMGRSKEIVEQVFPGSIKMKYVVSDYWAWGWSLWDAVWQTGGWIKYFLTKLK